MSSSGVDERDVRPPFFEMLRRSFRAWWRSIVGMPVLLGAAFAALTVFWLLDNAFGYRLAQQVVVRPVLLSLLLRLTQNVVETVFTTPFCIALQLLMLRQTKPNWQAIARAFPVYVAWVLLIDVVGIVVTNPQVLVAVSGVGYSVAAAGLLIVALLFSAVEARLWLIFPAVALNVRIGFLRRASESWAQTRGNFWYVFGILMLTTLSLIVPLGVVQYLERTSGYYFLTGPDRIFTVSAILLAVTSAARAILDATLSAAAGACLYRALVEGGGPADVEGTAAHFT